MKLAWFTHRRWFWHLLYWTFSILFLIFFLGYQTIGIKLTLWFVLSMSPVVILTTYFFNEFLIPRFLVSKMIFRFLLYSAYAMIASLWLELVMLVIVLVFGAQLNLHAASFNAIFLLAGTYIPVVVGIAIKLYRTWQQSEERNLRLLQQKTEEELKFLKSQIHPHFLFNTLNNLYALVIEKSDRAGEVVLQLSDLLSYILYDCNNDRLPLKKEYEQICNYISLEKLRYGNRVDVHLKVDKNAMDEMIMPLTLLPLLENSFKHGVKPTSTHSYISLIIEKRDQILQIHSANSLPDKIMDHEHGGIGIENLKTRLDLYYGKNYKLITGIDRKKYQVILKIKMDEADQVHDHR